MTETSLQAGVDDNSKGVAITGPEIQPAGRSDAPTEVKC